MRKTVLKVLGNDKGFTLMELVMVSGGMLILLGAAALFNNQFSGNSDLISSQQALLTINRNTFANFKGRGNYLGLTNLVANDLNIFPPDMVNGAGAGLAVQNRYNGNVTLQVNAASNLLQDQIWTNLPMNACMNLALFSPDNWISVDVNGTPVDPNADTAVATVNGACNAAGNVVTWTSN